ncbi:MAG TPA: nucleotide sugar dehydrogenase, partial [Acidimicrobiia bacterium]|nr:nucleotide sugar dehydrogenase [Acidimicrobiia bacterium]
ITPPTGAVDVPFRRLSERLQSGHPTVGVVGLGYVGLPLLVHAAGHGCRTVGVEIDPERRTRLAQHDSYVTDVSDDALAALDREIRIAASATALLGCDAVVITVPTPLRDGVPDLSAVRAAANELAEVLRPGQLVILESTTYPGTTDDVVRPALEGSGLRAGVDFALAYAPERIDPGSGRDVTSTPRVVAGIDQRSGDLAQRFYERLGFTVHRAPSPREAELAKLIENTFRQVNIALVNELAVLAADLGVDIWAALEAAATKPYGYMAFRPGPGVGGHCIAIDPSYLSWHAVRQRGFGVGFVQHALEVNHRMPAYVASRVAEVLNASGRAVNGARIFVLGVTYKPGVADTRESPAVAVIERLLAGGADISYHDPFVSELVLGNRRLQVSELEPQRLRDADIVVVLTAHQEYGIEVLREAGSLFDAQGVTSGHDLAHAVRL